jgi:hypothetical protein
VSKQKLTLKHHFVKVLNIVMFFKAFYFFKKRLSRCYKPIEMLDIPCLHPQFEIEIEILFAEGNVAYLKERVQLILRLV